MNRPPLPPFTAETAAQKVRMAVDPPRPPIVSWFTGCSNRRGDDRRIVPAGNGAWAAMTLSSR
jgi:hypothetical protein